MTTQTPGRDLDPATHYHQIYWRMGAIDFPWDMMQSLSFALFRTYAVPSIGGLLDRTAEFGERPQKRYDDTALLLNVPLVDGMDSKRGRAAIRRINQMHRMYDISNDDMLYVLSTFVVVPKRWIDDFGWRRLTSGEIEASVRYNQELARRMGIREIPADYAGFETLMDDYERKHFAFDQGGRRVADSTLALLASFYPRPLRRPVSLFSRALMDDALLDAFHYRRPSAPVRALARGALRIRARVVAVLPARRHPVDVADSRRIRSYPNGFTIQTAGTFTPGCPVPHLKDDH